MLDYKMKNEEIKDLTIKVEWLYDDYLIDLAIDQYPCILVTQA
jgi:hypothetical protein